MAAIGGAHGHHKKKSLVDGSGMTWETKQHFEHVKQKMFAFVDNQRRMEGDPNHLLPPPHPMFFADQDRAVRPPLHHHRSPVPPRKHHQTPFGAHKKLPHLGLATPQVARRVKS